MAFPGRLLQARSGTLFRFYPYLSKLSSSYQVSQSAAMLHTYHYPGINYDLRFQPNYEEPDYPNGAYGNISDAESELLPIREIFMMALMESLTSKANWQEKVLDETIVANWREEALVQSEDKLYLHLMQDKTSEKLPMPRSRILSEIAFDYCIKELREKAVHFKMTGLVPCLDAGHGAVVKSDTVVTSQLQRDLRMAFERLRVDQVLNVDWHPRSGEMVQDLVHPSMYPFIYARSNFIQEEVVGVSDAVEQWAGKGEKARVARGGEYTAPPRDWRWGNYSRIPTEYWSSKYQWLPSNLSFQDNGTVKFTSYINNLHPKKYPEIYHTIETLVDKALPAWDQCLVELNDYKSIGVGRQKSRFSQPKSCYEEDEHLWEPFNAELLAQYDTQLSADDLEGIVLMSEDDRASEEDIQKWKWRSVRDAILPEPDDNEKVSYSCLESLREKFKKTGLQVIVKMASIELTPEKPEFPAGGWHVEGQMNEHICATALYYLDSENITPSHLSFRMQTSNYQDDLQAIAGQDAYNWLERVYGTSLGPSVDVTNACIQHYGNVETREGRLLAFPNTFQHRVSSFKLQDPTKPGHRRFIALWLVNPHRRIVSTANVPPQQLDWWRENQAVSEASQDQGDNEADAVPKGLMSFEEAEKSRLELIDIRSRFHESSEADWQATEYSFCEH